MLQSLQVPLKKRVGSYSFYNNLVGLELFSVWQKVMKKEFAREQTQALVFRDNTLTVAVSNSVFAQELKLREVEIMTTLNQFLQKKFPRFQEVKKIIYRITD